MITLTNKIDITRDVTLDASGQNVIISGNNTVRLFNVSTGVTFNVTNVSMINGRCVGTNGADAGPVVGQFAQPGESVGGAAVRNNGGTVRLVSCVLSNHSVAGGNGGTYNGGPNSSVAGAGAGGSASGGAILNSDGAVYLLNSTFVTNSTAGGLAGASIPTTPTNGTSLGGAVASLNGVLVISNTVFFNNLALGRNSPLGAQNIASGGAIYMDGVYAQLTDSLLVSNSVVSEASSGVFSAPVFGGGMTLQSGTAILTRMKFITNSARGRSFPTYRGAKAVGGAIYNLGTLVLSNSTIASNLAQASRTQSDAAQNGQGGGVFNEGVAILIGSTFNRNLARGGALSSASTLGGGTNGEGGAIYNSGTLMVTNSTLTLNKAQGGDTSGPYAGDAYGGAIYNANGTVFLMNTTIASNSVIPGIRSFGGSTGGSAQGANIANTNGSFTLRNSLLAYPNTNANAWGTIIDGGFNISSDASPGFSNGSSFNSIDPKLGPLTNNGGPTFTMALLPGSPARDSGTASGAPATDQRGVARPYGAGVDMGAFEIASLFQPLTGQRSGGTLNLSFYGEAGMSYRIERSSDLLSWELQESTGVLTTNGVVVRSYQMTEPHRFFRLGLDF